MNVMNLAHGRSKLWDPEKLFLINVAVNLNPTIFGISSATLAYDVTSAPHKSYH